MSELVTIVELESYAREVDAILACDEQAELKSYLAANPEAGAVIRSSGGVRKLRWAASGRGKRGGARVIYYFHDLEMPLFLISIFTKNQKADLDPAQPKQARQFAETISTQSRKRK